MNVVIFTQGVSPIVEPILEKFQVLGIIESAPRGSQDMFGRTKLTEFCRKRNLPYFWLSKGTSEALVPFLIGLGHLDVGAVYSMSQLLPQAVLDLFPLGVLNCHPSKLPAYRGPNPYFWTFYDGCKETALTVHYLDKGEDTGDIILQRNIPIQYDISQYEKAGLVANVKDMLGQAIVDALSLVRSGDVQRTPQPKVSTTVRACNVTPDNVRWILSNLNLRLENAGCFFANTLDMLPLRQFGIRRLSGDWKVKKIVPCVTRHVRYDVDKIYLTRHGFSIVRPDGWVLLKPGIGHTKFIAKLIRDWLICFKSHFKIERFDFYRLDTQVVKKSVSIDVREVDHNNLDDVIGYRNNSVRDLFLNYLNSGQKGYYAYKDGKVVGHAWVMPKQSRRRRLFGWLPVPKGEAFIYYCRARHSVLKYFVGSIAHRLKIAGAFPIGISAPSSDIDLRIAIKENGFAQTTQLWKLSVFRVALVF